MLENILNWFAAVGTVMSLITAIVALVISAFFMWIMRNRMTKEKVYSTDMRIKKLGETISVLQSSIMKVLPGDEAVAIQSGLINTRIDKLAQDMRSLRELLFDNPEATVTIPLMKKDIDALAKENEALRSELDRQSTFTRWFLGILITMSIGLFGLTISILLKGK